MKAIISNARKEVSRILVKKEQSINNRRVKFDIGGVPIVLTPHAPTPLSSVALTKQLNAMGLNCAYVKGKLLEESIAIVHKKVGNGSLQSFGILYDSNQTIGLDKLSDNTDEALDQILNTRFINKAFGNYIEKGWSEHTFGDYQTMLAVI